MGDSIHVPNVEKIAIARWVAAAEGLRAYSQWGAIEKKKKKKISCEKREEKGERAIFFFF